MPFIEALNFFFRVKRKIKPRTVKAQIVLLNKVIRLALHRRIITRPPFDGFEMEKTELKNKSLTNDELDLLMKTPLKSGTQRFIRDMFLFSTFTGLAYEDVHKLSWKDIITEDDGSLWISANRQKSHTEFNVKLLNIPIRIMEYYKGLAPDGKIFPHMSLGQVNVGLKRIARNCGINRKLSYHMARHSYATLCLSMGVPIETISQTLGHRSISTTQIYAEITRTKINEDMTNLADRIEGKYKLFE